MPLPWSKCIQAGNSDTEKFGRVVFFPLSTQQAYLTFPAKVLSHPGPTESTLNEFQDCFHPKITVQGSYGKGSVVP